MLNKKPDFKILDGLRGIAATYVVVSHCRGNLFMGGNSYAEIVPVSDWSVFDKVYFSLLQLTSMGREFVIFFFVLSGFSIAHSLRKENQIKRFYQRRLIRLYPPYIIALIWAALAFTIIGYLTPFLNRSQQSVFGTVGSTISNLLYLPKGAYISQFWSLTFEVIFYLLIPFAILRLQWYYLISVMGYIIGWVITWKETSGTNYLTQFLFDYNIFFALGIGLYYNYERIEKYFLLRGVRLWLVAGSLFCLMAVVKYLTYEENKISMLLSAVLGVVLIINFQARKITNPVIHFLGAMSYTIYITHLASIFIYKSVLLKTGFIENLVQQRWIWPTGVFVCITVSCCIYFVSERPTKKILDSLRNESKKQQKKLVSVINE